MSVAARAPATVAAPIGALVPAALLALLSIVRVGTAQPADVPLEPLGAPGDRGPGVGATAGGLRFGVSTGEASDSDREAPSARDLPGATGVPSALDLPGAADTPASLLLEGDITSAVPGAPGDPLDIEMLKELVRAHNAHVRAGENERALQAAQLLREIHESRYGEDSYEALRWVSVHGFAFLRLGRWRDARRAFDRAVLMTEHYEGPFAERLVELLPPQARALSELGEFEAAESALLRAKFITHRRGGINNLEQADLVRQLRFLYLQNYAGEEAAREQQFLLRIFERNYGDSPELVDALYEHAGYYMSIGDYQSAIPVYQRAIEILEDAYGEDDLRLVTPLRGIASAHIRRNSKRGEGERALERVVAIYDSQASSDVFDHARSLRDLGDWHMRSNDAKLAVEAYSEAWRLLTEADGNDGRARELLGKPAEINYIAPPNIYDSHEARRYLSPDRYLETTFRVDPDGRVRDAQVVNSSADRRTEFDNLYALRVARFRPAFVEGEPVSIQVTWRQYHSD